MLTTLTESWRRSHVLAHLLEARLPAMLDAMLYSIQAQQRVRQVAGLA